MENKKLRVAGYVRVSSPNQRDEGESLTTQRKQIIDFCNQRNWDLVQTYADEGISGAKIEYRTAFQEMIKHAEAGKYDVIVFTKLSRFSRNAREYLKLSYDLGNKGVLLASIKENIDPTTKTGKLINGILALFAEWEHETIREQMYENKMARWREKRTFVGKPPFAYRWNSKTKELEIDTKEAELYQRIVKMYLEQGMSYKAIAIQLRQEGIKCKKAPFASVTIGYLLKNPAYYGNYIVNQFYYKDSERGAGTERSKEKKPVSENISFDIPPLISKSRWNQIQETIEFRKLKSKRVGLWTKGFTLRDVLYCGDCGSRVKPRIGSMRKDGTRPNYYVCFWSGTSKKKLIEAGKNKCLSPYMQARELENIVFGDLLIRFSWNRKKLISSLFADEVTKERTSELELVVKRLELELLTKQKARERLYKFLESGKLDDDELTKRIQRNKEEVLKIEGDLITAKESLSEALQLQEQKQQLVDYLNKNKEQLQRLSKDIRNLDPEDKKLLIEAMLVDRKIVVNHIPASDNEPAHYDLDYKFRYNHEILARFMEEGKILRLDKNSSLHNSPSDNG